MPFYCGKRSAGICVVLGPKKSSTYASEYASDFFEPAASHLPTAPLPRNEGLLGQTPSSRLAEGLMVSRYLRDGHLSSGAHAYAGTEWPALRDAHTMRPRR
jgi:hypothetical protein